MEQNRLSWIALTPLLLKMLIMNWMLTLYVGPGAEAIHVSTAINCNFVFQFGLTVHPLL